MKINLNNKRFTSISNTNNAEVSSATIFRYYQKQNVVWASYNGGQIVQGHLIGKIVNDHLEFVYHHINLNNEIRTGECKSYPEITIGGKILLKEFWKWTCKDHSSGESTLIEM